MKEVKKIVIVGGGSAGWITASWFSRRGGAKMDVTIIDKYKPERVGVGEATLLRFYVIHCIAVPFIMMILMAVHFWRIRKDGGISGPL